MVGTACTAKFSQILICIVLRREKLTLQTKDGAVLRVYEINVMTEVVTSDGGHLTYAMYHHGETL